MIPDKIYLPKEEIEERKPWIETSYDPNWDECYIRKDALLEWLSDMKFMANSERAGAYQNVIDKLNEM